MPDIISMHYSVCGVARACPSLCLSASICVHVERGGEARRMRAKRLLVDKHAQSKWTVGGDGGVRMGPIDK